MQNDIKYTMITEEEVSVPPLKHNLEDTKLSESDKVKLNDIKQELGTNFIEYAVAVNTDRAIPDATSGLKPVAKRILWSAYEEGRTFSKPHVKAARIVGDVMGKYHPHGDSSIYGAMARLAQEWVLRYPLIDWHGNKGNQMGDGPAAARYTEARLSKIAEDGMLYGIKKKNVDFIPNYDETLDEPVTLPAIFPNLLCNPNTGIGVAMACNWLPHNLKEVAEAIYAYMNGEEPMLPGPDFPTGGLVINKNDIPTIMKTGHGSVKLRARYDVKKQDIIFYEIPYGQTSEGILQEISELCENKELEGITNAKCNSNKNGIQLIITCKKDVNPNSIAQKLYAKTSLQTSISYNQVALINKTPTELNLKQAIEVYVNHNIDCLVKETNFDLAKAKDRLHIVEGLLIALEDIDNVIALIKKSDSSAAAKDALIQKYNLDEPQAKAILAMRLSSLAKLEKIELENEKKELLSLIDQYMALLNSKDLQEAEVKKRLEEIVKKYGDARRTELAQIEVPKEEKEIVEVVPEDVVVVTTQSGLIKKVPLASFKIQKRNTKGIKSEDDIILSTIKTNTIDTMMFFSNKGVMYRTLVDNIPSGTMTTKGVPINSLVKMDINESIIAVSSLHRKSTPEFVIFVTKNGMLKKSYLEEYLKTNRNTGIQALKLGEGDSLTSVIFQDKEDMLIITKLGMSIRFKTSDVTPVGRAALGVKGIKLNEGDSVIAAMPIHKESDDVLIMTTNGLGKRVNLSEYTVQGRNGKGNTTAQSEVAGAAMVDEEDNVLIIGKPNNLCISVKDIPVVTRTAMGNKMIKVGNISSICKI